MLVTLENLNIEFIENVEELQRLIDEYAKLETAIENSAHYKLLAGKTQTLGKGKGVTKKERSRRIHTNNIANLVCKKIIKNIYDRILEAYPHFEDSEELRDIFELNRELAVRRSVCMAKAHDIGHVAFGHEGERAINDYFQGLEVSEVMEILKEHRGVFGDEYETEQAHISPELAKHTNAGKRVSFEHNELGALLLNQIIERNGIQLPPEDIKKLILGVLAHSTSRVRKYELIKGDLPAQVVRAGDKVEYRNADFDEIRALIEIDPDMPADVLQYLGLPLADRINKTNAELSEEAIKKGRIWEDRSGWDTEQVMKRLGIFRKAYEDAIFLYDSSYSYHLLKDELFPRLSDPEALAKFYEEHPGVSVFYPENKVREIYEKTKDLEARAESGETPSLEDEEIRDEIWQDIIPFKSVLQGENSERIYSIYFKVLDYYYTHPELIPAETEVTVSPIDYRGGETLSYQLNPNYHSKMQRALEYISLLDDEAMMQRYYDLVEERIQNGPGHGIEPVTADDMRAAIYTSYSESVKNFEKSLTTYSAEEAERIYVQKGNTFYSEGLTDQGKRAYQEFYRKRFAEYAIDQKLMARMVAADRAKGITPEDEFDSEIESVEPDSVAEERIKASKTTIAAERRTPQVVIRGSKTSDGPVIYHGPTYQMRAQKKPVPQTKRSGFVRALGIIGKKLTEFSNEMEQKEAVAERRREVAERNKTTPPKPKKPNHDDEGHGGH